MPRVTITVPARTGGGTLLIPAGLSTPHALCAPVSITGGAVQDLAESSCNQTARAVRAGDAPIEVCYDYTDGNSPYPDAMFEQRPSRFTRAADALIEDARGFANDKDPARAIANHVEGLFSYGHPDTKFYDDHDELPQLCSLTVGSCVDINAYFIASLRAAGVEAGYVTGYFFPAEKIDAKGHGWCNDMHCWVVTRDAHGIREWDIAHHMKMGVSDIAPALNPKPGQRFAVAHSMGLSFPALGLSDIKLISEPVWLEDDKVTYPDNQIRLTP